MKLEFSAATLHELREAVLGRAVMAGMPADRAVDVMFAAHELAANAVRHGAGSGQLVMRVAHGALYCEVSDAGREPRASGNGSWPVQRGHGLWLVRQVCNEVSYSSGPGGSRITAVFALPAARAPGSRTGRLTGP